MTAPEVAAVETVMRVQREHWFAPAYHGGYECRCGERFGFGSTAAEHVAREVVAALDLDTRDRAAEKRGAAKALRDFADEHVKHQSAGRIAEDLHAEADRIEADDA